MFSLFQELLALRVAAGQFLLETCREEKNLLFQKVGHGQEKQNKMKK